MHSGIPVEDTDCASCHEPHVSTAGKLILPVRHAPFAEEGCDACHDAEPGP